MVSLTSIFYSFSCFFFLVSTYRLGDPIRIADKEQIIQESTKTYPQKAQKHHQHRHTIKQHYRRARADDELQASQVEVAAPQREEPGVGGLLRVEEGEGAGGEG